MHKKLLHTSRQYLGLPMISGSEKTGTNTTHQVARTLDTRPKNTFDDFLRELINECHIHFHSSITSIQSDTIISVTNSENEIFYSTVEEFMQYL